MRALLQIAGGLMILGAVGHTAAAPFTYDGLSADALWFVAAGLFLGLLGALSLIASSLERPPSGVLWLALAGHLASAGFMVALYAVTGSSQPAIFLLLNLLAGAALAGILKHPPLQIEEPGAT